MSKLKTQYVSNKNNNLFQHISTMSDKYLISKQIVLVNILHLFIVLDLDFSSLFNNRDYLIMMNHITCKMLNDDHYELDSTVIARTLSVIVNEYLRWFYPHMYFIVDIHMKSIPNVSEQMRHDLSIDNNNDNDIQDSVATKTNINQLLQKAVDILHANKIALVDIPLWVFMNCEKIQRQFSTWYKSRKSLQGQLVPQINTQLDQNALYNLDLVLRMGVSHCAKITHFSVKPASYVLSRITYVD